MSYNGPIFIIGLGRSGTKLLRDLLNNHPQISIPEDETGFIPYLLRKYESADISKLVIQRKLYYEIKETSFYIAQEDRGKTMSFEKFLDLANQSASLAHLIEWVLRYYSPKGLQPIPLIWGDKTPRYMDYVVILKKAFPSARFIHIYRDVRDYALSYKNAWNKSMLLAAHKWNRKITELEHLPIGIPIAEVEYNNLLKQPNKNIEYLCEFLGVDFFEDMILLKKPSENLGRAKNISGLKRDNYGKYHKELTSKQIKKIEEIALDGLSLKNFIIHFGKKQRKLSRQRLYLLKVKDFGNFFIHILFKERGLYRGIKYILFSVKKR